MATFPAAFLFLVAGLKLIEGVVVLVVWVGFKKDEKKFRQIAKENEQVKSELPPLLGGEVKAIEQIEKED